MDAVEISGVEAGIRLSPTVWLILVAWLLVSVLVGLAVGRMIRNRDGEEPNGDG